MQNRTLLIRYDEIGLKGKNRRHFENQLVRNIRNSLKSIKNIQIEKIHGRILGRVDLVDAEGSIRCFIQHQGGPNKLQQSVADTIAYEESIGMDQVDRHVSLTNFIETIKAKLHDLLDSEVKKGKTVAGFGTSIGATTFSYNYELGELLSFFVDDDPYRHNLISPGLQIPVLPSKMIYEKKVDYVIILAPLYADAIMKNNQKYLDEGGTFIKIWPEFEVIKNA